jgi:O-antigen/teichoic acid export membrane protein
VGIQVLTLISGVLVARTLQPAGRGIFTAAQLWPGILAAIGCLGANYSFAVQAARNNDVIPRLKRAAATLAIASSAVFVGVGWVLLPYVLPSTPAELSDLSRAYLIYVPVFILTTHLQAIDQGAGRLKAFNRTRQLIYICYFAVVLLYWLIGVNDVSWFLAALLGANVATLLLRIHLSGWESIVPEAELARSRSAVWEGRTYLAGTVASLARDNVERLLILFLLGSENLGLYVVAATASGVHTTLAKSVGMIVLPRSGSMQLENAIRDTARIFRVLGIINALLSALLMLMLPWLVVVMFGSSFSESSTPAVLLVVAQLFATQGMILDEGLRAQLRPGPGLAANLSSVGAFCVVAYLLAQSGVVGVACASIVSQCLYCLLLAAFVRRRFRASLIPTKDDVQFLCTTLRSAMVWACRPGVSRPPEG